MATNNALNNVIYPYSFCFKKTVSVADCFGTEQEQLLMTYDEVVYDPYGAFSSGYAVMPISGTWLYGASMKLDSNYTNATYLALKFRYNTDTTGSQYGMGDPNITGQKHKATPLNFNTGSPAYGYRKVGYEIQPIWSGTSTDSSHLFGIDALDATFPVLFWGYCIAPDYDFLAFI